MSELRKPERDLLRALRDGGGPQAIDTESREARHLVSSGYAERRPDGRLAITPAGRLRIYEPRKPVDERRRHDNHEGE